jgi:hypothetical protein
LHISGKKGILISDEKRNMLAAANKKKNREKTWFLQISACHSMKIGILYVQTPIDEKRCITS